jgi:hypothetical protein
MTTGSSLGRLASPLLVGLTIVCLALVAPNTVYSLVSPAAVYAGDHALAMARLRIADAPTYRGAQSPRSDMLQVNLCRRRQRYCPAAPIVRVVGSPRCGDI